MNPLTRAPAPAIPTTTVIAVDSPATRLTCCVDAAVGALPYATPGAAGAVPLATSAAWAVGNEMYTKGYRAENPDGRSAGFKVRTAVFRVWMYGSALSVACFAVRHFGVYELP